MGIRGIDAYLRESKLLQTAPLSALNGSRLGIDAKHYLTNLLTSPDSQEPLLAATGGVHLSITQRVENDLRTLDRNHIKPVFIFPGLPTQGRPPHKGFDPAADRETRTKEEAWECYENGDVTKAVQTLSAGAGKNANGSTGWTDYRDVVRLVLRVFKHRVVEYIFAPYLEQAQLAYLLNHPKGYIHAIYTSTESLLWQVDKVITHIDFPTSFTFVDKSQLLPALRLSPDQFLDMGILAGCSLCRTFPPTARDFTLGAIIDIVKNYKSGLAAVQQYRGAPADAGKMANYPEAFMRARLAIRFSFIYTTEGICMPYALAIPNSQVTSASDVPADIDEIFSPRLPDELYFYMCKGVISPQVIGWLTTGMIVESQPLSDSYDYQRFAKELLTETSTSPRILALALLADSLHPQWKQRRVGAHYWHDPAHFPPMGAPVNFNHKDTQGLVAACSSWKVSYAVLEQELRRQSMSTIDIKLCIGALADEQTADKTTHPSSKPLERKDEFVANVIWRFLYLRGFIVGHDHRQALIGQALHTALLQSKVNDRFQEPMFIVLELMRAGVLHGQKFGNEYRSGGPVSGSEEDQASSMLIMRCLSVLPLNFRPHQWAGPLSRELLVFNSFPRGVSKSLRHLLEAISANMLLTGAVRKNRDEYMDLILSLPFQTETNTGFGILFKTYLDVTLFSFEGENGSGITESNMDSQAAKDAKAQALEFVEQSFESVKNPRLEVERGFRFWDTVMTAIKHIESVQSADPARSVLVQPAVLAEYKRADQWLKPLRP